MSSLLDRRQLISKQTLVENSVWVVGGFLRNLKSVGKLNFATLSDISGSIQLIFKDPIDFKKESVLLVAGELVRRKSINPNIPLGEWELIVKEFLVLSEARKVLPFELIEAADKSLESTRLKYRYLDLRSGLYRNLIFKSQIVNTFRNCLLEEEFVEINTPSLSISSREGANTFDTVVLKDKKKAVFSLSQSPQLYKQLLMISGVERYFQIANCFRLEDLRSDRQYEFLQIDIELAFSNQNQLFSIIERAFVKIFRQVFNKELKTPFLRLSYDEALNKYGSDKPDIRHGLEFEEYTEFFKDLVSDNKHSQAYGFFLPNTGLSVVEDKWLRSISTKNNIYIVFVRNNRIDKVHLMNHEFEQINIKEEGRDFKESNGVLILVTFDNKTRKSSLLSLGALRLHFSRKNKNELKDDFRFIWIVDWPLFEYNETQDEWVIAHHLFTKPVSKEAGFSRETERSLGYDLVLNGVELASGSERNNDLDMQKYIFKLANISDEEVERDFGWFLEAFNYGVPPHLGIAIGVDRTVQVLLGTSTIRDVIAFPKNNHGVCFLTNAPRVIDDNYG